MPRNVLILCTLAWVWVAPCCRARENNGSPASPVKAGTQATIQCLNEFPAPLSEDAERAMPLRVVGAVSCGERVMVVEDSAGLSVRIRTLTGQDGYIERAYLAGMPARDLRAAQPEPSGEDSGVARWHSGAPGSSQFFRNGSLVQALSASGISVQISAEETGRNLRTEIAIGNHGTQAAYFDPARFTLDELTPRLRSLARQNPRGTAKTAPAQASMTNVSAPAPTTEGGIAQSAAMVVSGADSPADNAGQAGTSALRAGTLTPNHAVSGVVWFEGGKKAEQLTLRVFVDDQIFEFPLSFPPRN
ncbi:MAG TPA: SH3 domain-containing protein [Candidatus Acidoferrum sp.]|nr:SH3 domain-containing protein [Candidatus Acidoferrum sp.]